LSALNPTARDLARLLTRHETRIAALEAGQRTSQLQHASLTGTAITVYDEDGVTRRGAIGIQPDGTLGLVAVDGPAPGVPTAPVVTPSIGGLRVVWDGQLTEGSELPADFDHVAVHVSTTSGFTPSAATFVGTITRAGQGGMLPVAPLPYAPHYVVLVAVNTSGISGDPSAETAATPVQVTGPDLTAGSVTAGTIAAGAVTADKLEAVLQLVTRLVAGDPAGARVELNEDGLRVYDSSGALTIRFDSATGDAVFTGEITGSEVTGGTITGAVIRALRPDGGLAAQMTPDLGDGVGGFMTANDDGNRIAELRNSQLRFSSYGVTQDWETAISGSSAGAELHLTSGLLDHTTGLQANISIYGSESGMTGTGAAFIGMGADGGSAVDPPLFVGINGVLEPGNFAWGRVTVNVTTAGTPASAVVSGLNIYGSTFQAFVTPLATAVGNVVTGVGIASISGSGATVYANRSTTGTVQVAYLIIGV
jgi:hypothetical protein